MGQTVTETIRTPSERLTRACIYCLFIIKTLCYNNDMKRQITYKNKVCDKCGKTYTPTSSTQSWCSDCLTKKCEICGKLIRVRNKSKYDKTLYCSDECRQKGWASKYVGEKAPNYRNGNRSKTVKRKCTVCGKTVQRQISQKIWENCFCSPQCRSLYNKKMFSGEKSPKYSKVEVVCEECGKVYKTYNCTQNKTRFCSKQCRANWQSKRMSGTSHPLWNNGSSGERSRAWVSREYKAWRKAVFERDNYTCQKCGDTQGGNLNAHHIKPFAQYKELRYDVSNGITLCEKCHIEIHSKSRNIPIK